MIKNKIYISALFLSLVSIFLGGCGNSSASYSYERDAVSNSYYDSMVESPYEEAYEEEYASEDVYAATGAAVKMSADTTSEGEQLEVKAKGRKLIKTVNLSVQTKEFDTLISTVTTRIDELGGYAESLDVSGYEYNASKTSVRNAYIVARIPADKLNSFVNTVSDNSNIISKNESVNDVTLEYTDVEAHRNSLRVEQERLDELLGEADSIETIVALESRLTEVRYELESYESRLRNIDNRVDYSTVYLSVQEVKDYTPVVIEEKPFLQRLAEGFAEGCDDALEGLKDFIIGFATVLPGLVIFVIILAIVAVILFFVVKCIVKLCKKISDSPLKKKIKPAMEEKIKNNERNDAK